MKKILAAAILALVTASARAQSVWDELPGWWTEIISPTATPILTDCTTNVASVMTATVVNGVCEITFQEFAAHAFLGNNTGVPALPGPQSILPDDLGANTTLTYVLTRTGASTMNWAVPPGGLPADADYGDVTVSSAGTVWTVDNDRTFTIAFKPEEAQFLATAFPQFLVNAGTNFPVSGLAYDATTDEAAFWKFIATGYNTGNLTLTLYWYADTSVTSAASIVWEAQITAITPDTDTTNVETDTLATLNYVVDTLGSTDAQKVNRSVITISNLDSIAAGDLVFIRIARDANGSNGTDDLAGDAILVYATLSYARTF